MYENRAIYFLELKKLGADIILADPHRVFVNSIDAAKKSRVALCLDRKTGAVLANIKRKEHDAIAMADALSQETLAAVQANVLGSSREHNPYIPAARVIVPPFMEAA